MFIGSGSDPAARETEAQQQRLFIDKRDLTTDIVSVLTRVFGLRQRVFPITISTPQITSPLKNLPFELRSLNVFGGHSASP